MLVIEGRYVYKFRGKRASASITLLLFEVCNKLMINSRKLLFMHNNKALLKHCLYYYYVALFMLVSAPRGPHMFYCVEYGA